jgi:Heterokaryon incompatibility protein (HET)
MASSFTIVTSSAEISPLYRAFPIPLGSKCIRLLTIHAPSMLHGDGGPIEGSFSVVDLDQRPPFTALSYVWGTKSVPPKTISCGGSTVSATDNCYSALVHLRRKLSIFTIWVDAVCIDQDNADEKSQQIPLMGEIYSHAQTVYVWLREGTPRTDRAMNFLPKAGLLDFFPNTVDLNGGIFPKTHAWKAFWSLYSARWTVRRAPMPIFDYSKLVQNNKT